MSTVLRPPDILLLGHLPRRFTPYRHNKYLTGGMERQATADVKPGLRQEPFPVFCGVFIMHRKEPKSPLTTGDGLFTLTLLRPTQVILEWTTYPILEEKDTIWGQNSAEPNPQALRTVLYNAVMSVCQRESD